MVWLLRSIPLAVVAESGEVVAAAAADALRVAQCPC